MHTLRTIPVSFFLYSHYNRHMLFVYYIGLEYAVRNIPCATFIDRIQCLQSRGKRNWNTSFNDPVHNGYAKMVADETSLNWNRSDTKT